MGILEVRAEDDETNQQEWQGKLSAAPPKSRVDFAGTIITAIQSAPSSLADGECAWWLDISGSPPKVRFTANVGGGTPWTVDIEMHQ